jgi:hypothetical protein
MKAKTQSHQVQNHKNKIMKNLFVLLTLLFTSAHIYATDLVVQESGPVGTYSSIGAAVAASADGDRIIINNKTSALAWQEDIIINKSLTFLSAVDNQRFLVQGDYTVQHAVNREVTIIGMENTQGNVAAAGNGSSSRTVVNILWCKFFNTSINFHYNYFELNVASCEFTAGGSAVINLMYGKVIGNDMAGTGYITVIDDNAVSSTDTVKIVGNKQLDRIGITAPDYYVFVTNNTLRNISSSGGSRIDIISAKLGSSTNIIKNNTMQTADNGIYLGTLTGGHFEIYNNVIADYNGWADYGIFRTTSITSNITVSYNHIMPNFDGDELKNIVNDGTNNVSNNFTVNAATGTNTSPTATNGGNPGVTDYDLDLTVNNAGALGGSYTLTNFFPLSGASSKVWFLEMPSEIIVGANNAVTGYSFDQ